MPRLVLEHSDGLDRDHDLGALSAALFEAACTHPVFAANPKAVKVVTVAASNVNSGVDPQTYAHLTVWMLDGRSEAEKTDVAQALLSVLEGHLPDVGTLSVDPRDMARATYAKRVL